MYGVQVLFIALILNFAASVDPKPKEDAIPLPTREELLTFELDQFEKDLKSGKAFKTAPSRGKSANENLRSTELVLNGIKTSQKIFNLTDANKTVESLRDKLQDRLNDAVKTLPETLGSHAIHYYLFNDIGFYKFKKDSVPV